ncbi:hypothetical protein BKA62DRAFT_718626 [Auriculariales sp. MPI-PUGE-AT-0066]|nr:hypothetical protein BKA62DRAFT_718626 [Auriculariales sp. MPI-PUGE-AT-0066]
MCTAALALIVYDYILTFDEERQYVWGRRLSVLQILFFLNRYPPVAFQLANLVLFHLPPSALTDQLQVLCQSFQLGAIPAQVEIQWSVAAAIVGHRLMALYADNVRVKVLIFVVWFAAVVALMIINIIILPKHGAKASGLPFGMHLCHPTTQSLNAWIPSTPAVTFDLFAFLLALFKLIQHRRAATRMHTAAGASVRIYDSMAIGSTLYFLVILTGHIVTMYTATKRESLSFIWIPMMFSLSSIACSHMIIDVRSSSATPAPSDASSSDLGSAGSSATRPLPPQVARARSMRMPTTRSGGSDNTLVARDIHRSEVLAIA